jgi:hypothetical protein
VTGIDWYWVALAGNSSHQSLETQRKCWVLSSLWGVFIILVWQRQALAL